MEVLELVKHELSEEEMLFTYKARVVDVTGETGHEALHRQVALGVGLGALLESGVFLLQQSYQSSLLRLEGIILISEVFIASCLV